MTEHEAIRRIDACAQALKDAVMSYGPGVFTESEVSECAWACAVVFGKLRRAANRQAARALNAQAREDAREIREIEAQLRGEPPKSEERDTPKAQDAVPVDAVPMPPSAEGSASPTSSEGRS